MSETTLPDALAGVRTPEHSQPALHAPAHRCVSAVLNPQVLALRQLITGGTNRFPSWSLQRVMPVCPNE